MKKSEIKFEVSLDANHVPEAIDWSATDGNEKGECEAVLMSIWDKNEKNTLKIDLWTKTMEVDDMKILIHQTLLTLTDTYERATGDANLAKRMREFGLEFGQKAGIIKQA